MASAGLAKLGLGADEEAVERLRRSVEINRHHPVSHFWLAAALAHVGRLDEARSEVRAGLAINPTFTISRLRDFGATDDHTELTRGKRVVDGMRKAGVPDG
jgi:tetratricopeptide (TPR) repeat protein